MSWLDAPNLRCPCGNEWDADHDMAEGDEFHCPRCNMLLEIYTMEVRWIIEPVEEWCDENGEAP